MRVGKKKCKFDLISRISFIIEGFKSTGDGMMNKLEIKINQNYI